MIILKINKTYSNHYRSPYGNPNSTTEVDRTPETVSPVEGKSRNRKVPSDHNTNTHTLIEDGRKFYRFSPHLFVMLLSVMRLCVAHILISVLH